MEGNPNTFKQKPGMNRWKLKKVSGLIVAMLFGVFALSAQSSQSQFGTATLTNDLYVTLDHDTPLTESYVADISKLEFESETQLVRALNEFGDEHVTFDLDYKNQKVFIHLSPEAGLTTVADWGMRFKMQTAVKRGYIQSNQ